MTPLSAAFEPPIKRQSENVNKRQLLDAVKLYYRLPGHEAGGNLHLVLSDGNCDDSSMWVCIVACVKELDTMGLYIASAMLFTMTEEQRDRLYCDLHGLDYLKWIETVNDAAERENARQQFAGAR